MKLTILLWRKVKPLCHELVVEGEVVGTAHAESCSADGYLCSYRNGPAVLVRTLSQAKGRVETAYRREIKEPLTEGEKLDRKIRQGKINPMSSVANKLQTGVSARQQMLERRLKEEGGVEFYAETIWGPVPLFRRQVCCSRYPDFGSRRLYLKKSQTCRKAVEYPSPSFENGVRVLEDFPCEI